MVYKCLFIVEKNTVKTFYYRDGKLELIKYKGDDFYVYDSNFITWWNEVSSYITGVTEIDLCILVNENTTINTADLLNSIRKYGTVSKSSWNKSEIESIIREYLPTGKIILKQNEREYVIPGKSILALNAVYEIYTHPDKEILYKYFVKNDDIEIEDGMIAKYYRNKTKELERN